MKLSGWGKYPFVEAEQHRPVSSVASRDRIADAVGFTGIVRGLGRSYGDSSLASNIICTSHLDHMLNFDGQSGRLSCEAGISLAEILKVFVPRGWFLPVTPGTKFVSLGGAIASDVHGKNHHGVGSFGNILESFHLLTANDEILQCSPQENADEKNPSRPATWMKP